MESRKKMPTEEIFSSDHGLKCLVEKLITKHHNHDLYSSLDIPDRITFL